MYAHLATMSRGEDSFILSPMNPLPAEVTGGDIEAQKQFIRDRIIKATNEALPKDKKAWDLACRMGSDFAINAFAVNFKYKVNGNVVVNEDERLSSSMGIGKGGSRYGLLRTCCWQDTIPR